MRAENLDYLSLNFRKWLAAVLRIDVVPANVGSHHFAVDGNFLRKNVIMWPFDGVHFAVSAGLMWNMDLRFSSWNLADNPVRILFGLWI